MSVDEFATHISSSLPGGGSRVRPGRLIVSTSQLKPALVVSIAVIMVSLTICVKCPMRVSTYGETCGANMRVGRGGRPNRPDARRTIGLRRLLPLETGRDRGRSVRRG